MAEPERRPPRPFERILARLDDSATDDGRQMHELLSRLYPICRSITGDGVRRTLSMAREYLPIEVHEVASGTRVFDWTVPDEWNVRAAWIEGPDGERLVDFADHNLHLMSYSVPVDEVMALEELQEHLHSLPDQPDLIPYRTSYYRRNWGFCLPHNLRQQLPQGDYRVRIDSSLAAGSLTYGELLLRGESSREILLSCHICHPSLANDNLSSLVVSLFLARALAAEIEAGRSPRYSYRFLWIPGTIGSITWLARNREAAERIDHGLVAANLGDAGDFHYKRSRQGDAVIDRAVALLLRDSGRPHQLEDFVPFGYDERQYCSPGFNLAVGSLTRTPWGRYAEYHTSADNPTFVQGQYLAESLRLYAAAFGLIESNRRYLNLKPHCEPQLGRRGLYRAIGGGEDGREKELAMLWVLNLSDGDHDLLAIAERSALPFNSIVAAAEALLAADLLRPVSVERDQESP